MRDRIIRATVEEINLRGFKFTMSDIAKRLSISKTSIYEHFSSKDVLISTILDIVLGDLRAMEQQIINSDLSTVDKLKELLTIKQGRFEPFHSRIYEDLRSAYPCEWEKVTQYRNERMNLLVSLFEAGVEEGSIRQVNVAIVQQMIQSTINDLSSYRFLSTNNMTYPDAVSAMVDILSRGFLKNS